MLKIIVPGQPMAWQRARQQYSTGRFFDSADQTSFKSQVRLFTRDAMDSSGKSDFPIQGRIWLDIAFYFKRPKNQCRRGEPRGAIEMSRRPDLDNCLKMIGDALNGLVWEDDGQISYMKAYKYYHEIGGSPRTEISVY